MKKFFKFIFLIIVAIIIVAIAGAAIFLVRPNTVTKKSVVEVLSFVLKTDVELGSADVSISKGKCVLRDLVIKNPEGFKGKDAFSAGKVDVDIDAKAFNPIKPEIKAIRVENPQIKLEIGLKGSNLGKLSENASRMEKWRFKKIGNRVKIGKIIIEGAKVNLSTAKSKDKSVSFGLPRIEMDNLGGTVAGTIRSFLERILRESIKAGKEHILGLGDEEAIKNLREVIGGISEKAEKTGEDIKEDVKNMKDKVKDILNK